MTAPPLPASSCVRIRMDYVQADANLGGNRFYLAYSGGAPSAGNCATLAADVAAAWASHLASLVQESFSLQEVDVLDITTVTGASGQWTGNNDGTDTGTIIPASVATNIEFGIARRYRGGKPRIFLPPPGQGAMFDGGHWTNGFQTSCNTGITAFFAELIALDIGSMGTLSHVNLSYYNGFKNITNSSGRTRAVPTYRDTALVDTVNGYATKLEIGSQRRRRIATTY